MQMLKEYFELEKKIHEYFGYKEDWVTIPLADYTDQYWHLTGEGRGDEVMYAENREDLNDEDGNYYGGPIYTQRFLNKWVYRTDDYTMVCYDAQTDGNKYLAIFDNSKEVK